jgi:EpsI family protein
MMRRRETMLGAMLALGGVAALWVKPRAHPETGTDVVLDDMLGHEIPGWQVIQADDVILADVDAMGVNQYDQLAIGQYRAADQHGVTVVLAHGAAQSPSTQLHRPEFCYPASGFEILMQQEMSLEYAGRTIPVGMLAAQRASRLETVLYWTRIGSSFPLGIWEQRIALATGAFHATGQDGLLARFSTDGIDQAAMARLERFTVDFVTVQNAAQQRLLLGSTQA